MRAGGMGEQRESRAKGTYRKLVYIEWDKRRGKGTGLAKSGSA